MFTTDTERQSMTSPQFVVVTVASNGAVHAWGRGTSEPGAEAVPFETRNQASSVAQRFRREEKRRQDDRWERERGTVKVSVCQILGGNR